MCASQLPGLPGRRPYCVVQYRWVRALVTRQRDDAVIAPGAGQTDPRAAAPGEGGMERCAGLIIRSTRPVLRAANSVDAIASSTTVLKMDKRRHQQEDKANKKWLCFKKEPLSSNKHKLGIPPEPSKERRICYQDGEGGNAPGCGP